MKTQFTTGPQFNVEDKATASTAPSSSFSFSMNPFVGASFAASAPFAAVSQNAAPAKQPGSLVIGRAMQEKSSGTVFDGQLCAAKGADCRDLVAVGLRNKRLLGIKNIDVYAIGLFVDPAALHKELGAKYKGAVDSVAGNQAFLDAVACSPNVPKSIQIVITSSLVNRQKLVDALKERMEPPLVKMGKKNLVSDFNRLFDGVDIKKGTSIVFHTAKGGALTAVIDGKKTGEIKAPEVGQVLVQVYTGASAVQKDIKDAFAKGLATAVNHHK